VEPQYEYCADQLSATGFDELFTEEEEKSIKKRASGWDLMGRLGKKTFASHVFSSRTHQRRERPKLLPGALVELCAKPIATPLNNVAGPYIIKKQRITHILVLCSTFGKVEIPTFGAKLIKVDISDGLLHGIKLATLALGSTMYPDFCEAGKKDNKKLLQAGARKLAPIALADEANDSPGTGAEWINLVKNIILPKSLELAIEKRSGAATEPLHYDVKWGPSDVPRGQRFKSYQWPEEQCSECVMNEELLAEGGTKNRSTRQIGFKVPPGSSYTTEDHLCVNPLNRLDVVRRFALCFLDEFIESNEMLAKRKDQLGAGELVQWQLQQPFELDCIDNGQVYPAQLPFSTPITLDRALQANIGLSTSAGTAPDLLGVVKEYIAFDADSPVLTELKKSATFILEGDKGEVHQNAMDKFLSLYPTVVDLLEEIVLVKKRHKPERTISLAHVLSILPRLQPRLYSISSSSVVSPDVVEISVDVVNIVSNNGVIIAGVCSNYLTGLIPGIDRAKISIRGSSFRGPVDLINTPMIMVGAGTGLSLSS